MPNNFETEDHSGFKFGLEVTHEVSHVPIENWDATPKTKMAVTGIIT